MDWLRLDSLGLASLGFACRGLASLCMVSLSLASVRLHLLGSIGGNWMAYCWKLERMLLLIETVLQNFFIFGPENAIFDEF